MRADAAAFPATIPLWGNDQVVSCILLRVRKQGSSLLEYALLTSALEVRRSKPYKSYSGHSTLDLRVQRWSARGYSRLLGKTVEYRLSPGRAQPPSSVQALQTTSDFPAHVVVNAVFDLLLGGEVVSEGHGGSAQAFGLTALPPSGSDTFSINSVVEDGGFELEAVFCAAAVVLTTPWQRRLLRIGRFLRLLPAEVVDTLR